MASLWVFSLVDQAVPVNATDTTANLKSIFELPAPSGQGLRVVEVEYSFDLAPNETNKPLLLQLIEATATGTFPSSSVTPSAVNEGGHSDTSPFTAANVKFGTATAEGTLAAGNGFQYRLLGTGGVFKQLPLGRELFIAKAAFLRIRSVVTVAVNATFNITVEV